MWHRDDLEIFRNKIPDGSIVQCYNCLSEEIHM